MISVSSFLNTTNDIKFKLNTERFIARRIGFFNWLHFFVCTEYLHFISHCVMYYISICCSDLQVETPQQDEKCKQDDETYFILSN